MTKHFSDEYPAYGDCFSNRNESNDMKDTIEIRAELRKQESLLQSLKDKYSRLHQIDMQSGEGSQVRGEMNRIQGFIDGLIWVLDND